MGTRSARWVPRENSFFRETLGESAPKGPRIGVLGGPAALRCQRQGPSTGVRHHGCCRGAMWVPCCVGGYPGKTRFFRETVGTIVGGVLTMDEQGNDPRIAIERGQVQGCDPMGIIKQRCGYSNRLVGTQGKLDFRETLGKRAPVGPRISVFGASGSASSLPETGAKHRGANPWVL